MTKNPGDLPSLEPATEWPVPLSWRIDLPAIVALYGVTLARYVQGKRILVLGGLFVLPVAMAVLARIYAVNYHADQTEFALVFMMIPHTLAPLTALVYSSGMIQDEIEEQTLTYLLIRPLPRWAVYLTKLAATVITTALLAGAFTMITMGVVHWGEDEFWSSIIGSRAPKTAVLIGLALVAYNAIFGCLSLFVRRSLAIGVAYIVLFEGVLANIDFVARKFTVMYNFRVLCERWVDLRHAEWSIDLASAPSAYDCAWNLLVASAIAAAVAATTFTVREFRVKTPEGS